MKSPSIFTFGALFGVCTAIPRPFPMSDSLMSSQATSKVYLAGDSTMCSYAATSVISGWGQYLPYSLSLSVVNDAIGGRSARSFTVENRFSAIAKVILPGDFIVIEFGHNDGGTPAQNDNGRSDCPGTGNKTCDIGSGTLIKTFDAYISEAAVMFAKLGAYVIVSSQTPNNPWEGGTFSYSPSRFVTGAELAVQEAGNKNVTFVDHGLYVANAFKALGKDKVNAMFPQDHTHTGPQGADVVSQAFVKALLCGSGPLKAFVKNETSTVTGSCV